MVMGCRMTITREGDHADDHKITSLGGSDRHMQFTYTIDDNRAFYSIAGYAVIQTENLTVNISTQGKDIDVYCNNPAFGRPDVTFNGSVKSFSEGDEYTWNCDQYKFYVRRAKDSSDYKEFYAKILPR